MDFDKISVINVDFPDPDTPVTDINFPKGKFVLDRDKVKVLQENGQKITMLTICVLMPYACITWLIKWYLIHRPTTTV